MNDRLPEAYTIMPERHSDIRLIVMGPIDQGDTVYTYLGDDYGSAKILSDLTGIECVNVCFNADGSGVFYTTPKGWLQLVEHPFTSGK